jgi:hypothetical protein
MAPPIVLPAVATRMAHHMSDGFSSTRPASAGSDPSGNKVADTSDTTNSVSRPYCGNDSQAVTPANQ